MTDYKPSCCDLEQQKISAGVGGHPIYDASCDCTKANAFVPKDGIVIEAGGVVFFTGNDVSLSIDGTARNYPEVNIADAGKGIAGIALKGIDNSGSDVGSMQFLTAGRIFSNRITLNGASSAALTNAGFDLTHVYS